MDTYLYVFLCTLKQCQGCQFVRERDMLSQHFQTIPQLSTSRNRTHIINKKKTSGPPIHTGLLVSGQQSILLHFRSKLYKFAPEVKFIRTLCFLGPD